jgi:hypothetical protein
METVSWISETVAERTLRAVTNLKLQLEYENRLKRKESRNLKK